LSAGRVLVSAGRECFARASSCDKLIVATAHGWNAALIDGATVALSIDGVSVAVTASRPYWVHNRGDLFLRFDHKLGVVRLIIP